MMGKKNSILADEGLYIIRVNGISNDGRKSLVILDNLGPDGMKCYEYKGEEDNEPIDKEELSDCDMDTLVAGLAVGMNETDKRIHIESVFCETGYENLRPMMLQWIEDHARFQGYSIGADLEESA